MDIIKRALSGGQAVLSEYESKRFLSNFDIPVCREAIAYDADSAAAEAVKIGFPVVLKASGESLLHKTEVGGVVLNIASEEEVRKESHRLLKIQGTEALLVQEMVKGDRELVCGLIRDPEFGPCVMFGIGGVLTEVFQDVAFRVAPLTSRDAREMVQDIRNRRIMEPFRGQPAIDIDTLCQVIVALGKIGLQYEDVHTIDINPLKIRPDGKPVVLDALVVLNQSENQIPQEQHNKLATGKSLTPLFEPSSVVIIGASADRGKLGHEVIRNILANDYTGRVYLVNPKAKKILGMPVYPSVVSLPEVVDLAVVLVPARSTPQALRECADKGIKAAVLVAGGFAELNGEGEKLQKELTRIVAETGIRVLGPNTVGHISTPHNFTSSFYPLGKITRGNISYIAQTGNFAGHTVSYIMTAENFGVARVIGLGNKIDIDESEMLEYLAQDPETKAIFMYLESLKRPRHFIKVASEVTRLKPVFLLKGGATREGLQAAVAHTAALASDERIIEGALKQAGVTQLYKYSHLILVAKALAFRPLPKGNRVSFLAPSGAMLVVLSDLCRQRWGLVTPDIQEVTRQRLQDMSTSWIRMRNPVDIWPATTLHGIEYSHREAIKALMQDPNIDAIVVVLMLSEEFGIPNLDFIIELTNSYPEKLLYVTFTGVEKHMEAAKAYLEPRGVPTFRLIEEPFEVLSILSRCQQAMKRPR